MEELLLPVLTITPPETAGPSVDPDAMVTVPPCTASAPLPARTLISPDDAELDPTTTASFPEDAVPTTFPLAATLLPEDAEGDKDSSPAPVSMSIFPLTSDEAL